MPLRQPAAAYRLFSVSKAAAIRHEINAAIILMILARAVQLVENKNSLVAKSPGGAILKARPARGYGKRLALWRARAAQSRRLVSAAKACRAVR